MIKNITQLEVFVNDKSIRLLTDMDTDVNLVREALKHFNNYIDQIVEAATKKVDCPKELVNEDS